MLALNVNSSALSAHHNLIKCWLSKKIKGNRSRKNRLGNACEDDNCEICKTNRHKSDLPQVLVDFFTSEKIDALINEQTANLIRT